MKLDVLRFLASACVVALGAPVVAAPQLQHLQNGIEVRNASSSIRVTALTDSIIRVRMARGGRFGEDASWAVPADVRRESVRVAPTARGFRTKSMELRIDPSNLKLEALDLSGKVISADAGAVRANGREFELRKAMPLTEHYFGMGDKTGV